jgi:hypothetical protein
MSLRSLFSKQPTGKCEEYIDNHPEKLEMKRSLPRINVGERTIL